MSRSDFDRMNSIGKAAGMRVGLGDYFRFATSLLAQPNSKIWWVNSYWGSDTSQGDRHDAPLKTIQAAIDKAGGSASATDAKGDIIVLQASQADYDDDTVGASLSNAYLYVNKSDLTIVGLGPPNSVIIKPDAAATAGVINLSANADRFRLINVTINTTTARSAAIKLATGTDYLYIDSCIFDLVGAAGPLGYGIDGTTGKVSYPRILNCEFHLGVYVNAGIALKVQDATPFGGLIDNCYMVSNAAANPTADGILISDGTGMQIKDVVIHGGTAAQNITDGIDIDAGVLNTMITGCLIGGCDNALTDGGTDTLGATNGITAIS